MPGRSSLFQLFSAAALILAAIASARAQDAVAQFYKGKQINIYVGSSAGGGYDTLSLIHI